MGPTSDGIPGRGGPDEVARTWWNVSALIIGANGPRVA